MYHAFKALHLIGMVCWFAGLFYMFRLFVYWRENNEVDTTAKTLETMSRKLYYYITCPSMIATLIFGFALLSQVPTYAKAGWLHAKLGLILVLVGYNLFIGRTYKRFRDGDFYLTSKQCRMINEIPVVMLVAIVLLAVFKW